MATKFTLTGIAVRYDNDDNAISVTSSTFEAVFANSQPVITYSVLSAPFQEVPEVQFGGTEPLSVTLNGSPINENSEDLFGYIQTEAGQHIVLAFYDPATNTDHIFQVGGVPLTLPTTAAQFNALNNSGILGAGIATGAFAPGVNIPLSSLSGVQITDVPNFTNPINGTDGDDFLQGTDADDIITTRDATSNGDQVIGSGGNDTIDMSGMNTSTAFMSLNYNSISGPITATVNGVANTGTVVKGSGGTDTLIGVKNPMDAGGFEGGFEIRGTSGNDTFNVTAGANQWVSLRGGAGADSYVLNSAGTVRIDFRDANVSGININLATGQVLNDGFGNAETITGSAGRLQIYGSGRNDTFTGSAGNDIYRYFGGNNVINGGAGYDLVRYDANTVASINADLSTGGVNGVLSAGGSFSDTLSNVEALRGSAGGDRMVAANSGSELDGRNGNDTLLGGGGTDRLWGGAGDDYINPGDNSDFDAIEAGTGSDIIDLFNAQNGYFSVEHWSIRTQTAIDVTIDSTTNSGFVNKGFLGMTTFQDVTKAMRADGLGIAGTDLDDRFTLTVGGGDYLQIQAGRGADSYTINGTGNGVGEVRLLFNRDGDFQNATQGLVANLATGVISNDGFGFQDSLTVGSGVRVQIMGTNLADDITGSDRDDFFLSLGGNDTIRGGDGFDVVSYNRNEAGAMRIDLAAGRAQGTHDGQAFTDTLSSIEGAIGSRFGNDVIKGSSVGNYLSGRGGDDILYGDGYRAVYDLDEARAVYRLYQATLDRAPDTGGQAGWTELLADSSRSLQQVAAGFVASPEFQSVYGSLSNEAFVGLLYQNVLGRTATAGEISAWATLLDGGSRSREQVVTGFSESTEFRNATNVAATQFTQGRDPAAWQDDVYRIYQATLARDPDFGGFSIWTGRLGDGSRSLQEVAAGFVGSQEFQNVYGALNNTAFVELLYQNVLGRAADSGGLAGWLAALDGGQSRAQVVLGFSQSPEFVAATAPGVKAWIRAQGPDDYLEGGAGSNDLWGGAGADVFRFDREDAGSHRVHDFEAWDYLEFRAFGYADAAAVRANMTQQGADVVFSDQGTTVTLANTQLASIDNDTFVF